MSQPKIVCAMLGYDDDDESKRTIIAVWDDETIPAKRVVEGDAEFMAIAREVAKTDRVMARWLAEQEGVQG